MCVCVCVWRGGLKYIIPTHICIIAPKIKCTKGTAELVMSQNDANLFVRLFWHKGFLISLLKIGCILADIMTDFIQTLPKHITIELGDKRFFFFRWLSGLWQNKLLNFNIYILSDLIEFRKKNLVIKQNLYQKCGEKKSWLIWKEVGCLVFIAYQPY